MLIRKKIQSDACIYTSVHRKMNSDYDCLSKHRERELRTTHFDVELLWWIASIFFCVFHPHMHRLIRENLFFYVCLSRSLSLLLFDLFKINILGKLVTINLVLCFFESLEHGQCLTCRVLTAIRSIIFHHETLTIQAHLTRLKVEKKTHRIDVVPLSQLHQVFPWKSLISTGIIEKQSSTFNGVRALSKASWDDLRSN